MRGLVLLFLLCALARAEDIYVSQNAAGADDGTGCVNAKSLSWLHTSGNWGVGAGKVSAGDTFHCCGTFTNQIRFMAGGTAGSPIRLQAEPGMKMVMSVLWINAAGSAICTSNFSNVTVDGGADGYIKYTDNGTSLTYQSGVHGITGPPPQGAGLDGGNITISNWRITNIFVWVPGTTFIERYGGAVYLNGGAMSNVTVHNVTIDNADKGIYITYGSSGISFNWTIASNNIQHCSWGIAGADGAGASMLDGLYVHHNTINGMSAWDSLNDTNANNFHENGSYFWADQVGSQLTNCFYYANRYGPDLGNSATSALFTSSAQERLGNINIYNNVFLGYPPSAAGMVLVLGGRHVRVFNNTFAANNGTLALRFTTMTGTLLAENNLFFNLLNPMSITDAARESGNVTFICDYNSFFSLNPNGGEWGDEGQHTWAEWYGDGRYDHNSITNLNPANNPLLVNTNSPYDMNIQAGSPVIGAGVYLGAFGYPGQSVDINGVTRPNPPSIGAYEFVAEAAASPGRLNVSGTLRVGTLVVQ